MEKKEMGILKEMGIPDHGRKWQPTPVSLGFLGGSAGKESAYNVGDLCLIPGLRRSPVEGKGYPFQSSGLGEFHDCIVRDSLESSAKPQFKTINSLVLSFL